ncbi:hypothetical protein QFC19_003669 [Naganishia cerealis]|uniref:Uncharacterized protein n=1 Tax=Naganishia cerealis TaxID=610337 RepID=A0ACC2W033_9TREE|nr:hypothetical protein QFC19_003669 [Naganishia cerealis]
MRLFHSRLTLCVLVTLGVVYYGASATPLKSHNHTKEGISQRATLRHEPNWYGRGRMDDFGNCVAARHRGEGKDGPRRKVRIRPDNKQHTATTPPSQNSAQKHTSDKEIEQPVQAEKTSNPITSTIQEETKEESPSSAATTSTSTIESAAPSTQTTDSGGSHNNVPEVSAPSLKSDQVGIPVGGNMVSQDMQNELVRLHNALRGANGQGDVQWDDKLARYSAGWMNKCRWEHSGG